MSLDQLGRFKITGTLGKGAMGTVYRAHDPLIDRTVAIKTIGCAGLSLAEAKAFEARFYSEAKSAGRLNHPNIVTIHDVGRTDDLAYIAMEYLNGRTLQEILDAGVALPIERSVEIAARIADGLAFAHANDVVHRDIKPANIMVFDSGAVKIADFGVALIPTGSKTLDGMTCGSPKYMAPEQINGSKVDGRADIFSLGVVLYEMLVGRSPFNGDNLNAILFQVLNNAPPLPSSFNPAIPHGIDRIVARALAKNPDKRFQSAGEMAADLRKWRRIVKLAQKEKAANDPSLNGNPRLAARQATAGTGSTGREISTLFRFGLPLLLVAGIAAWALSRPSPPPASAPLPQTQIPSPPPAPAPEMLAQAAPAAAPDAPPVAAPAPSAVDTAPESESPAPAPASPETAAASVTPPPVEAVSAPAEGRIRLAIAPWGEVHINGKKMGVSPPLSEVRLAPGKHSIEIRNGDFPTYRRSVELSADAPLRIKHKFE